MTRKQALMRPCRSLIVLLYRALGAPWALSQSIRICVISADTGKPLDGKEVSAEAAPQTLPVTPGSPSVLRVHPKLKLKTGHGGWAAFALRELGSAPPDRLLISVAGGNWTQCSPPFIAVGDVLRSGVVAKNDCRSNTASGRTYSANPGELIVFTRHISLGEKVKRFPQ